MTYLVTRRARLSTDPEDFRVSSMFVEEEFHSEEELELFLEVIGAEEIFGHWYTASICYQIEQIED